MFPLKDDIPTDRRPWLTIALIAANVVVFFLSLGDGGSLLTGPGQEVATDYGARACELSGECRDEGPATALTVLSSMFLHGGLAHIGGNMLFLWIFGNNVEDSMGRLRFLAFYLLGGVAAVALQVAVDPGADVPLIGASGAVAGVLGGYLLLFPRARVLTAVFLIVFFAFVRIPAIIFLGIWIAQQALFGYFDLTQAGEGEGGGVAYFAHIGGFVFGLVTIKLWADRRGRGTGRLARA